MPADLELIVPWPFPVRVIDDSDSEPKHSPLNCGKCPELRIDPTGCHDRSAPRTEGDVEMDSVELPLLSRPIEVRLDFTSTRKRSLNRVLGSTGDHQLFCREARDDLATVLGHYHLFLDSGCGPTVG